MRYDPVVIVFGLILLVLVIANAGAANSLITTANSATLHYTEILQGRGYLAGSGGSAA